MTDAKRDPLSVIERYFSKTNRLGACCSTTSIAIATGMSTRVVKRWLLENERHCALSGFWRTDDGVVRGPVSNGAIRDMWCSSVDGKLSCFMPSLAAVEACGVPTESVVKVRMTADDDGPLWCWHSFRNGEWVFVFPNLQLLSMCFPDGVEVEESSGTGIRQRVRAEIIKAKP